MLAAVWLMLSGLLYSLQLSTGSFPRPLTAEEEQHYLKLSAQGDLDARTVLIERNLRLVAHIMKKYYAQTSDQEDLISIGTIGLIKGITTFDASKGARLATYAARCVENATLSSTLFLTGRSCGRISGNLAGGFWTNFRRSFGLFPGHGIHRCSMRLCSCIVLHCILRERFWKRPSSISGIADMRKSIMYRTGSAGADTAKV